MRHLVRVVGLVGLTVSLTSTLWATKLVTYSHRGEVRLGAYEDNAVIDLNRAYALLLRERGTPRAEARAAALVPPNMLEFLQGEEESIRVAKEAIQFAKHAYAISSSANASSAFTPATGCTTAFTSSPNS